MRTQSDLHAVKFAWVALPPNWTNQGHMGPFITLSPLVVGWTFIITLTPPHPTSSLSSNAIYPFPSSLSQLYMPWNSPLTSHRNKITIHQGPAEPRSLWGVGTHLSGRTAFPDHLGGIVGQGTGWTASWFADHVIWGSSCPLLLPDRMISFYLLLASPWYNHSAPFLVFTLLISGHFLATSLSSSIVDSVIQSTWNQFQCGISANIKFNQPSHLGIYWLDPYLRRYFCNTLHKASLPIWW